jgi:hypothetical protein
MASAIRALEEALYTGSSTKGYFWAFIHPNPDAPPQTFRLTRRSRNGWDLLLAASKETKEVLSFYTDTPEDRDAVQEALRWLSISGRVEESDEGPVIRLADGKVIPSQLYGGEKPKKKK